MMEYRCDTDQEVSWFFTVSLVERKDKRLRVDRIDNLRRATRIVTEKVPLRSDVALVTIEFSCPGDWAAFTRSPGDAREDSIWVVVNDANDALRSPAHPTCATHVL
jgi:hypothetical protein